MNSVMLVLMRNGTCTLRSLARLAKIGLLSILASCQGCWGSTTNQEPVTGTVTLDAQPLTRGTITFAPIAKGRSAGATIEDGEFSIARQDGPEPGTYQVSISARVPTGRKLENPSNPGEFAEELQQILPPRYNSRSELTAEVRADGENHFEFRLDSAGFDGR